MDSPIFSDRAWTFLLGSQAYRLGQMPAARRFLHSRVNGVLAVTALGLTLVLPFLHAIPEGLKWTYYLLVATGIPWLFHRRKSWKGDRWIGELSCPIYIVHFLAIWIAQVMGKFGLIVLNREWMSAGITLALAIALAHWVIEPVERLRRRRAAGLQSIRLREASVEA